MGNQMENDNEAAVKPKPASLIANENGMTLIEILTALVIFTMVTTILYSFLFMGISMYKRIMAESQIRSQGDAIVSQVISELKDAVYMSQGASTNEITFVKRALTASGGFDNETYVKSYKMRIEPIAGTNRYGIGVYELKDGEERLFKRFDMVNPFTFQAIVPDTQLTKQALTVDINHQLVDVHLVYEKLIDPAKAVSLLENPGYEIHTKIPLFRSD
jgi:prepilin-type N-terminal cleavage/methylation domain-containing protein